MVKLKGRRKEKNGIERTTNETLLHSSQLLE